MVNVTLPDGSVRQFDAPVTVAQVAASIGAGLAKAALAGRVNGELVDTSHVIDADAALAIVTDKDADGLDMIRHSTAHLLAYAVKSLYPDAQVTIGPVIDDGFFYDFSYKRPFTPDDLVAIEKKMTELAKQDLPVTRSVMPRDAAVTFFRDMGEAYKAEIIASIPSNEDISLYREGDFIDLCRGPHLPSTGRIKAFKLTSVAGAYWRGDERNKMLQRIYGTAFPTAEALEKHLFLLEEARRRDHRKLGRELDLFSINEEAGAGLVLYHPKGALLRTLLEDFEKREHLKRGYQLVIGPQILKLDLWKRSGHYENYRDKMYFTEVEGQGYGIKPMNCLAHMLIYKSKIRSYRDLPLRYFELGTVHRHEKSGELHGLLRVRGFTQDDAHILCTPDQLNAEIKGILDFVADVMKIFDFPYTLEISTRPEQGTIGSDEDWDRATHALRSALEESKLPYQINKGEGAFYGPKIDVKLQDALKREWQCATIQVDFAMPERFELSYIGADGEKHRPVMVHRVILGAMERFIGVLTEHFAGAFPTWLAPVQVILLTVTDPQIPYAEKVYRRLVESGIRVEKDFRNEKLGLKIREAEMQKIPYMVVIGDREVQKDLISPRARTGKAQAAVGIEEFVQKIKEESSIGGESYR